MKTRFAGIHKSRNLISGILLAGCLVAVPAMAQPREDPFRPGSSSRSTRQAQDVIASVEFVNADITDIFKMISDLTGWSVVMSPGLTTITPKISLWIKNLTPDQVLEQIASLSGIVVERNGSVVHVISFDEYAKLRGVEKRVVVVRHNRAKDLVAALQPFIDEKTGSRVLADEVSNQVVVLAPEPLQGSLKHLVERLDVPMARDEVRLVPVKYMDVAQLIPVLEKFLLQGLEQQQGIFREETRVGSSELTSQQEGEAPRAGDRWLVRFMVEPKLNLIVLRGLREDVQRAAQLIEDLDMQPQLRTVGYQLQYTNAQEAFRTLDAVLDEDARRSGGDAQFSRRLRIASSEQNNRIVVEGSPRDHDRIATLIEAIDQPLPPGTGGFKVYRLENASAEEVANVLERLVEERGTQDRLARQDRREPGYIQRVDTAVSSAASTPASGSHASGIGGADPAFQGTAGDVLPVRITAAPEINAVLIRASAAEQQELAEVIRQLDYPRDQVLLEVTLVSVRTDDGFRLGVELGGARINGTATQLLGLTSFGIADVDPATGDIRIADPPLFGANLGVFRSGDFSMVLNALRSVGETRITSSPRVLVQDNAPALISQINQEPFETSSQGTNTTVTSFGGFVDAGTQLQVIPHLSKADWLRLEYQVNLSSFGTRTAQQLAANLPPPRRESTSQGTVRVPNDHVVVLGGLRSTHEQEQVDRVPILGDIPLIGELFKSRRRDRIEETLYIFIRPVVMRDPLFHDLIHFSEAEAKAARITPESPENPMKLFLPNDPITTGGWNE